MQSLTETSAKTTTEINEAARAAEREAAEAFANQLRDALGLTPDTPRFHCGHDQHRRVDKLIRRARERVLDQAPLEGDFTLAAGYTATCAWHRFIHLELATDAALEYVQTLSAWDFCQFLGDLVVARATTGKAQDAYFCALATRVTTAARAVVDAVAAVDVEPLAQQYTEILRLAFTPYLPDPVFDLRIAPYSVSITYRREAGATETTWEAVVSGNRVLRNGVVDMDAASITLSSTNPFDTETAPEWLTGLIEQYTPTSW
ncbi:hypothetical protein [Streptomyces hokutonensis]|uniref:hypothetical protein n=1 Tax=Streptomyces hokutonensis TaxID=1306990 RepID=UPI000361C76B|nr:hypothetical protein [Streptomyces hokutonensis]